MLLKVCSQIKNPCSLFVYKNDIRIQWNRKKYLNYLENDDVLHL